MLKTKLQDAIFRVKLLYCFYKYKNTKFSGDCAGTKFNGWINTDIDILDITSLGNSNKLFKIDSISNILAEHVWEHLTKEESKKALDNCFRFLNKKGRLRIAVSDNHLSDKDYIDYVKPSGYGVGSDDHKVLYTYTTFSDELENSGFMVQLVEYFNESICFFKKKWFAEEGFVLRIFEFNERNKNELKYTSLILDGVKK